MLVVLFLAPGFAGCLGAEPAPAASPPEWDHGDQWTYLRHTGDAPPSVYAREVTGLFSHDEHEVYEITEGVIGSPVVQHNLYTVGRLLYAGGEVRQAGEVVRTNDATQPVPFHYLFPLDGTSRSFSTTIRQVVGSAEQLDSVEILARSGAASTRTIGDRVYQGWPYEIEIRYTTTPLDDVALVRGFWSSDVDQAVELVIEEAAQTIRYELLSFQRAQPQPGPPAYRLVRGLSSFALDQGFDAELDGTGYVRYLFHVETRTEARIQFFFPPLADAPGAMRLDLATLRPLGYTRAGIADSLDQIAEPGVVLHVAAARPGQQGITIHAPPGDGPTPVVLQPGQVYELLLATNRGGMSAQVRVGSEVTSRAASDGGSAEVVSVQHRRVSATTSPGPQNVRDSVTAAIALPPDARVEGLVYAVDHGTADALGEVGSFRRVLFRVDANPLHASGALYGFYHAYPTTHAFEVEAGFEYHADAALQGGYDYELGALLMRLGP